MSQRATLFNKPWISSHSEIEWSSLGSGHVAPAGVGAGVGDLVVTFVVVAVVAVVDVVVPPVVQLRALPPDVLDEHIQVGQTHAPPSVTHRFRKWHVVVL